MKHSEQPNLIYIFADQLRYFSMGYAGDGMALTPNIDRFSRQATDLCVAVSGHPVCAPYRASLFTGKYTTSTGMVINELRINTQHRTFADILNENGYETAYLGKWHLYAAQLGNHYDPKNSFIPRGRDRLGFDGFFAGYNFRHEYSVGKAYYHLDSPQKVFYDKYEPDAQTDMAVGQLKKLNESGKPFALFLSYGTPHDPWTPENVPPEYIARFAGKKFRLPENYLPENDPYADDWARLDERERGELTEWMRVYYAMAANLDDNFGRLLSFLTDSGLAENSIVVFTSDHGEMFGAHGRRAKNIFYEEAIRVPFLIRWPGRLTAGAKRGFVFNSVDIMPTLLAMMKLPVPPEVQGRNRSACVSGDADTEDGALLMGTGQTAAWGDGYEWRGWRTKRFTYAVYRKDGQELLFDDLADPLQMRNLIGQPAFRETAAELRKTMLAEMARVGDGFEPTGYYEKNWVTDRKIRPIPAKNGGYL